MGTVLEGVWRAKGEGDGIVSVIKVHYIHA